MTINIIWWLVLIAIAGEFGAVAWVRRDRYPRFRFSPWAPTLYALMILGDLLLGVLLTWGVGGGSKEAADQINSLTAWAVVVGLAAGALALLTLFFRWVAHTDIRDIADADPPVESPDQERP
jgi:hypothetical protein